MRSILIALMSFLFIGAASAADLGNSVKDVTITTTITPNWSGVWAGAFGGYGMTNTDISLDHFSERNDIVTKHNSANLDGIGSEGAFGEIQIGYDQQINRIIVGVYAGYGITNAETTFGARDDIMHGSASFDDSYFTAARFGVKLNDNTIGYIAGGWRWAEAEVKFTKGTDTERFGNIWDGPMAEIGLESRLTDNIFGRLAARYTAFEDQTFGGQQGEEHCWNELNVGPGELQIMIGAIAKFNGPVIGF